MECFSQYSQCYSSCNTRKSNCEFYDNKSQYCCFNIQKVQWWVWLILVLVILLLISLIACFICCCCSQKRKFQQQIIYVDRNGYQKLNSKPIVPLYQPNPVPKYTAQQTTNESSSAFSQLF
ncbi:Hypothetical_protein [Hexamita inflata]|uniref:Hypothetical_protein n=1 Tax=Hexamita inflata TaxID=28002 RepID=A0AA86R5E7_9EUKA|nr:Hypothetical protein HINF_LOCUS56833 [Hexamita inflata]